MDVTKPYEFIGLGAPFGRHPFGRHLGTQLREDAQRGGGQRGARTAAFGGWTATPLGAIPLGVISELGPEMTPKGVAPRGVVVQPLSVGRRCSLGRISARGKHCKR
jgi:hypothetical protein